MKNKIERMSFVADIKNMIDGDISVVCFAGSVYLEGVLPLKLGETEMLFRAGEKVTRVEGEGLYVYELEGDCVIVRGTIKRVVFD